MLSTSLFNDVKESILAVWDRLAEPKRYVSSDEVLPLLANLGYDLTNRDTASMVKEVARRCGWDIKETLGGRVYVWLGLG